MTDAFDRITDEFRRLDDELAAAVTLPAVDAVIRRTGTLNRASTAAAVAVLTVGSLGAVTGFTQLGGPTAVGEAFQAVAPPAPSPLVEPPATIDSTYAPEAETTEPRDESRPASARPRRSAAEPTPTPTPTAVPKPPVITQAPTVPPTTPPVVTSTTPPSRSQPPTTTRPPAPTTVTVPPSNEEEETETSNAGPPPPSSAERPPTSPVTDPARPVV